MLEKGQTINHTKNPNYQAEGLLPTPIPNPRESKSMAPALPHQPKTLTPAQSADKLAKCLYFFGDKPYE